MLLTTHSARLPSRSTTGLKIYWRSCSRPALFFSSSIPFKQFLFLWESSLSAFPLMDIKLAVRHLKVNELSMAVRQLRIHQQSHKARAFTTGKSHDRSLKRCTWKKVHPSCCTERTERQNKLLIEQFCGARNWNRSSLECNISTVTVESSPLTAREKSFTEEKQKRKNPIK